MENMANSEIFNLLFTKYSSIYYQLNMRHESYGDIVCWLDEPIFNTKDYDPLYNIARLGKLMAEKMY